jgi:hypothetical protein
MIKQKKQKQKDTINHMPTKPTDTINHSRNRDSTITIIMNTVREAARQYANLKYIRSLQEPQTNKDNICNNVPIPLKLQPIFSKYGLSIIVNEPEVTTPLEDIMYTKDTYLNIDLDSSSVPYNDDGHNKNKKRKPMATDNKRVFESRRIVVNATQQVHLKSSMFNDIQVDVNASVQYFHYRLSETDLSHPVRLYTFNKEQQIVFNDPTPIGNICSTGFEFSTTSDSDDEDNGSDGQGSRKRTSRNNNDNTVRWPRYVECWKGTNTPYRMEVSMGDVETRTTIKPMSLCSNRIYQEMNAWIPLDQHSPSRCMFPVYFHRPECQEFLMKSSSEQKRITSYRSCYTDDARMIYKFFSEIVREVELDMTTKPIDVTF